MRVKVLGSQPGAVSPNGIVLVQTVAPCATGRKSSSAHPGAGCGFFRSITLVSSERLSRSPPANPLHSRVVSHFLARLAYFHHPPTSADVDWRNGFASPARVSATAYLFDLVRRRISLKKTVVFRVLARANPPARWTLCSRSSHSSRSRPLRRSKRRLSSARLCLFSVGFPDYVSDSLKGGLPRRKRSFGLHLVHREKRFFYAPVSLDSEKTGSGSVDESDLALSMAPSGRTDELIAANAAAGRLAIWAIFRSRASAACSSGRSSRKDQARHHPREQYEPGVGTKRVPSISPCVKRLGNCL